MTTKHEAILARIAKALNERNFDDFDGADPSDARIATTEARWLRTPTFKVRYPDGSIWWAIQIYELRGDRIARSSSFFAPIFEAPEWRKPYVERSGATA